ncbi:MAG: Ig-like domain-containing protein [Clostridia bacterium]|nr:Ig-like domain-containing protein [Clostridia bacterium]
MFSALPASAAKATVDLSKGDVVDDLKASQSSKQSYICHGAAWVGAYSLFDVGSGTYLVYKLHIPANEAAQVTVDYKNWIGVGNGGVHQYTSQPKIRWYVTDNAVSTDFNGNVSDWSEIPANEKISLKTYTYTYTLSQESTQERTVYACMKFCDNANSAAGQAGWNDGAWVEKITFSTDASSSEQPGTPDDSDTDGTKVDLVDNVVLRDELKKNKTSTLALLQTGRWADPYALYDLGVGQFLLYQITLPAQDGVQVTVDYKAWQDVGNGGIHKYSNKPKTVWYVTDKAPAANFNGNTSGWTRIPAEEELSADTYTYTYRLAENEDSAKARTLYACMVFSSNDAAYHGQAGGNDGAWLECITFDRLVNQHTPVSGIALNKAELTLSFGKNQRLVATLQPQAATVRKIQWSSDRPDIVAVDQSGAVTAMGPGRAVITAKSVDGGFTASCTVTVPDEVETIDLTAKTPFDTKITAKDSDDALNLPYSWYTCGGNVADATQIVRWDGVTFRDLTANAYAIYRLRVPANTNAIMQLEMVTNSKDANGTHNGVLSSGKPRMHVFFTTDDITLATMDSALWHRADTDTAWNVDQANYTYSVSSMSSEDRTVYVKIYSTNIDNQGAWIKKLAFDTTVPTPKEITILPPGRTEYKVGETLDLRGMVVGVRYSDGSTAILTPDDYTVDISGSLGKKDTTLTVTTKDGALWGTVSLTILDANESQTKGKAPLGLIAGIAGGAVAIAAVAASLLLRRKKGKR